MKIILPSLLLATALVVGCKSTGHVDPGVLSTITIGMTREEVIRSVGRPETATAEGSHETLYYVEERPWWQWKRIRVELQDGKVVSYMEDKAK